MTKLIDSRERLRNWFADAFARTGKQKSDLARLWGVEPSAVTRVLSMEREVKAHEMEIAKAFFEEESVDGSGGRPALATPGSIQEIDVRAGAGGGGISVEVHADNGHGVSISSDQVKAEWVMPPRFVREELRTNVSAVRIVEVLGDSMEPTLKSGDRVLIDTSHRLPSPPGVYAVWDGYGIVIKRIEPVRNADRPMVKLISDNKNHTAYEVSIEEAAIVGRVICKICTM